MIKKSFEHEISYITARIAVEIPNTPNTSIGTGFFYESPLKDGSGRSITLLISNKHVFLNSAGKLTIILNEKAEDGTPAYRKTRNFEQRDFSSIYIEHPSPEVDLACVNVSTISHHNAFYRNLHDDFLVPIDYDKIFPSQAVVFVGYPENRYDVVHNLPLVRAGAIASLPSIDFNGKGQIVIDAQVFQGSSGSPIFVAYDGRYYLLGVISETMIRHSKLQTVPSSFDSFGVQQILGLGIAIKQRHVRELIDHAIEKIAEQNPAL